VHTHNQGLRTRPVPTHLLCPHFSTPLPPLPTRGHAHGGGPPTRLHHAHPPFLLGDTPTEEDPLRGCITLSGLPPATPIVFAAAGYAENGKQLGSIGDTSVAVPTALPLPRALQWGYLARSAGQLNVRAVARRASAELVATFIDAGPTLENWEQSPMLRWRLSARAVAHSAPAELRTAAQASYPIYISIYMYIYILYTYVYII